MIRFVRACAIVAILVGLFPTSAHAGETPAPATPVDIVILGGTAVVPPTVEARLQACTSGTVTRVAGSNRYATAAAISKKAFPDGATRAYLAIGTNYPDAVVAGAPAALNDAPLLLTRSDILPSETSHELERLGVTEVFVLGGTGVISSTVEGELSSSYAVTRLQGENRYATAAEITMSAFPDPVDTVYVATGDNFPDALVGGPAAYAAAGPILLTDPSTLSPETADELTRLAPNKIIILGGTAVVGTAVETALGDYAPVSRLAGKNRYATAGAVAETLPAGPTTIYVATGRNFPDALAATPLTGSDPLLLTSEQGVPAETAAAISTFTGEPCEPLYHVRVSAYTTYYTAGQARVTNIHTIARAVDGTVVQPGETFSLNDRVGQRTTAKGYVAAPAIINGEIYCCDSPTNIGGGTSQFATTLYNAIFFGGYEDVYHKPHSIWFSHYPLGREATLGYPGPDVKFRNDTSTPVTIRTGYTATSVTVEFWGWNDGRRVSAGLLGSATTNDGGRVRVSRKITEADGTSRTQYWWWNYNPLHPDRR